MSFNGHSYSYQVGGDKCVNGAWIAQSSTCNGCPANVPVFVDTFTINADGNATACHWFACVNGTWQEFFAVNCTDPFKHYENDGVNVASPVNGSPVLAANTVGAGGTVGSSGGTTTASASTYGGGTSGVPTPPLNHAGTATLVTIANMSEVANAVASGIKTAEGTTTAASGLTQAQVESAINNTVNGGTFTASNLGTDSNQYDLTGLSTLSNKVQTLANDLASARDAGTQSTSLATMLAGGIGKQSKLIETDFPVLGQNLHVNLDFSSAGAVIPFVRGCLLLGVGLAGYFFCQSFLKV